MPNRLVPAPVATASPRLVAGQQAVLGFLADLLGRAAGRCDAFAQGAGHARADAPAGSGHHPAAGQAAGTHQRQALHDGLTDGGRIADGRLEGVPQPLGLLDLLVGGLLGGAVGLVQHLLGLAPAGSQPPPGPCRPGRR